MVIAINVYHGCSKLNWTCWSCYCCCCCYCCRCCCCCCCCCLQNFNKVQTKLHFLCMLSATYHPHCRCLSHATSLLKRSSLFLMRSNWKAEAFSSFVSSSKENKESGKKKEKNWNRKCKFDWIHIQKGFGIESKNMIPFFRFLEHFFFLSISFSSNFFFFKFFFFISSFIFHQFHLLIFFVFNITYDFLFDFFSFLTFIIFDSFSFSLCLISFVLIFFNSIYS